MKNLISSRFVRSLVILSVFGSLSVLAGCFSSVEPLNRDNPPLAPGAQKLVIEVQNTDGSALDEYTIVVEGPETSINEVTSEDEYIISPIATGTYSVTVSKTGFRGQSTEIVVDLTGLEESDDFSAGALLELTKLNDPVTVGSAGGEITVPATGSGSGGTGSQATSVTVPPGAVPDGTEMSITVVPPPPSQSGSNITSFTLVGSPAGLQFDVPITVEFPIAASLANSGVQLEMVYATTGERLPVSVEGTTGTVEIPHFSDWDMKPNVTLSFTFGSTERTTSSACGEDLSQEITITGRFGAVLQGMINIPPDRVSASASLQAEKEGQLYFITIAKATFGVLNYSLTSGGNVIESGSSIPFPGGSNRISYSTQECHDSGG